MKSKINLIACAACLSVFCWYPAASNAGPLMDWLREKCGSKKPDQGLMATSGSFTQAPTYLQPGQCQQTCLQTCQRVTVNYVPYTDYRTTWQRVPVTQYKPVTNTDPRTGCTVTCMRPCTDYQWQLQRIPYTTYRPMYQTQNYQVPVTTITNDCATGNCATGNCATGNFGLAGGTAGCTTCGVPGMASPPVGGYSTNPGFAPGAGGSTMGVPADGIPVLNSGLQNSGDPYADSRTGAYRPVFPNAGNYSNANAYSGMSSYSGYQAPRTPTVYFPPTPSSFTAPEPELGGRSGSRSLAPADRRPVLEDFDSNPPSQPSASTGGVSIPPIQALPDPSPAMRWEYNTPPSGSAGDRTAHRDVQRAWDYQPVRLASYVAPAGGGEQDLPQARIDSNDANAAWTSPGLPLSPSGPNADWNEIR
jgi:hypothetical protein